MDDWRGDKGQRSGARGVRAAPRIMRTLAIGDIHGRHKALTGLLREVRPVASDKIIFLGDYIDRGPDSRGVIETLLKLQSQCETVFLSGNHELMMLAAREKLEADIWLGCGGLETLVSYGVEQQENWVAAIPQAHWLFFERTVRFFETANQIFVHGCLDPDLELNEQPDWILFWEYFESMRKHRSGRRVICGHTPQPLGLPRNAGYAVCIDTAAVYGAWLTCLDVDSNEYWQANEKGEIRPGKLH